MYLNDLTAGLEQLSSIMLTKLSFDTKLHKLMLLRVKIIQ